MTWTNKGVEGASQSRHRKGSSALSNSDQNERAASIAQASRLLAAFQIFSKLDRETRRNLNSLTLPLSGWGRHIVKG
jgi:hypothetical protein